MDNHRRDFRTAGTYGCRQSERLPAEIVTLSQFLPGDPRCTCSQSVVFDDQPYDADPLRASETEELRP